ncbi:MAG: hypothetical protein GQ475_00340 [Methylococcaceae bacterium]|nr:hypothetical protein [Methylococcaceae bacterium]
MNHRFLILLPNLDVFQFFILIVITICWAGPVKAKEIYFQPSIGIRTEYDDNKRLSTESSLPGIDKSAYAVITRANAKLGMRSSNYELELDNQLIINRYQSEFDLDSEDFNINLTTSYSLTERSRLGLSGNFTQDTTLTSELDATGTGLVQDNVIRQQWSITPNWSYSLSNTQFLQTNYTHSEITYEESERGSFVDYSIDNISLSFRQQWTSLLSNTLSLSAMSFKIPKIGSGIFESSRETTEYSVNIGVDYQISPTWSTSLTVGQRFTNTETTQKFNFTTLTFDDVTTSDDVSGLIFSFSVDKQFYSGSAGLEYSRSTSAQSQGQLQINERVEANYNYKVNARLQLSLTGGMNETSISGSEDNDNGRTYFNIRPSVRWTFNQQTNITVAYQYRTQTFESNNEEAVSNSVSLNFNYQWDKLATQRY